MSSLLLQFERGDGFGQRPSMRSMRSRSPPVTSAPRDRRRFRFGAFFSRMWLRLACRRVILPLPVILKRLAAPLWVFIFGIASAPLSRRSGGVSVGGFGFDRRPCPAL